MSRSRLVLGLFLVALVVGIVSSGLGRTVALASMLENWLLDLRLALTAESVPTDDRIAIVSITEETLATLTYRHPIDRGLLAGILRKADAAGARAIGFDILFDQATDPVKDRAFADAARDAHIPVFIGYADAGDGLTDRQTAYLDNFAPDAQRAYVNLVRDDRDGTVRATLSGREKSGEFLPGLANALAGLEVPEQRNVIDLRRGVDGLKSPFPSYPAHSFHLLPDSWIAGKILLVGVELPQEDRHATSFVALDGLEDGTLAGVQIHAQAVADLLDGSRIRLTGFTADALLAAFLALCGLIAGVSATRIEMKIAGVTILIGVLWSGSTWLLAEINLVIPLVIPTFALVTSTGLGATLAGRRHRAEKRFIREAMSRYVSPAVVEDLERHPEKLRLGGERRDLSLIFTDIAGFTTTSEETSPEVLVPVLNDYLDGMSRIVIDQGGTLDKFIGDALVAIFGAPVEQPDHAARAIACARSLDAFAKDFITKGKAKEIGLGLTRIGVHTGPAIVGNIGGDQRFDYTAIGDTVNTAARLEGANKYLGTTICISTATVDAANETSMRPVGDIVLKGRAATLRVFTPGNAAQAYLDGFEALTQNNLAKAQIEFQAALQSEDAALAHYHLERMKSGESSTRIVLEGK